MRSIGLLLAGVPAAQSLDWVKPSLPSIPPATVSPGVAYDAATQATVMFGGSGDGGSLNDTWAFSKSGWSHLSPATSPPARYGAQMAYDPTTGTVALFGGVETTGSNGTDFADTWTWDGVTWTQQFPRVSPQARDGQGMAYDPVTGTVVMFGGEGCNGGGASNGGDIFQDTWVWHGREKVWTRKFPAASPSARRTSLVYDSAIGAVLYGGDTGAGDCCDTYFNDIWTWNGVTWTQQFPASAPPARALPAVAYDAALSQIVIFGRYIHPGSGLEDTWTWNGSTWSQRQTRFSPPARWAARVDYDPSFKSVLLVGGTLTGDSPASDTWLAVP